MRIQLFHSIRFQFSALLIVLLGLFSATIGYTLHAASEREGDRAVLESVARLQRAIDVMEQQSLNYLVVPARDYPTYYRDVKLFYRGLQTQIDEFDRVLKALAAGRIEHSPEPQSAVPLVYTMAHVGHSTVERTRRAWVKFRRGLMDALGDEPDEPRLEYAAQYIAQNADATKQAAHQLYQSLHQAAQDRARESGQLTRVFVVSALLLMGASLWWFHRVALRPLYLAVQGFRRVAQGDFGHQLPASTGNEVGLLVDAFNGLSVRLRALFDLIDQIQQGKDLGGTLREAWGELRTFIPVDWMGVLLLNPDRSAAVLEHACPDSVDPLPTRKYFFVEGTTLAEALKSPEPLRIPDLQLLDRNTNGFERTLAQAGLRTAMLLTIRGRNGGAPGVLIFASERPHAYLTEHVELLSNIATLLSHSFEKSVVMENLVITAVEGLAKLVESRDVDTGDHLTRMSLYSTIISEELGRSSAYQQQVSPRFVRDMYRFAPMHDIGKVGIPDHILCKSGNLSEEERRVMNRHPLIGGEVLRHCESQMQRLGYSIFQVGVEVAEAHHERFDGSGYPRGLKGEEIPLSARIVAVADVFDALTSKRPYKEAWPMEKAMRFLRDQAGRHFDPAVIGALDSALPRIQSVYARYRHVSDERFSTRGSPRPGASPTGGPGPPDARARVDQSACEAHQGLSPWPFARARQRPGAPG